jgi:UDP-N-acetylmuramoyl-L-alanyl-D-glutamate--2,6-diaminopimelate ligase
VKDLEHVGVTGTNGKTSTTRFVAAGLGALARPVPSITTVGAFIDEEPCGTAMTRESMLDALRTALERGARYAALEVTSEVLARGFAQNWPFRAAVFTNLTHDHLDAHGSPEHYFASKAQLFYALPSDRGIAVVNGCDEASELLLEVTPASVRKLGYGAASRGDAKLPLDARAENIEVTLAGTSADVAFSPELGGGRVRLSTPAIGEIFLENALAALTVSLALGAPRDTALERIGAVPAPPGRFEVVAERPLVVIDYAHTPDALERTVATARRIADGGKITVVFGAGGHRDRNKRPAMGAAVARAHRAILTSDNPRDEDPGDIAAAIREGVPASVETLVELDRERAIRRAVLDAAATDVVVIAGKGHERTQTVGSVKREFSDHDVCLRVATERKGSVR